VKLQVLLADAVDTMQSGKHLVYGLYPDRVMVTSVPPDTQEPSEEVRIVVSAAFFVTVTGRTAGAHAIGIRFLHGDGSPMHKQRDPLQVVAIDGAGTNIVVSKVDFALKAYGAHFLELAVDEESPVLTDFEIRRGPPLAALN